MLKSEDIEHTEPDVAVGVGWQQRLGALLHDEVKLLLVHSLGDGVAQGQGGILAEFGLGPLLHDVERLGVAGILELGTVHLEELSHGINGLLAFASVYHLGGVSATGDLDVTHPKQPIVLERMESMVSSLKKGFMAA